MVKNRIALAALLLASFAKVFSSAAPAVDNAAPAAAKSAVAAVSGACPLRDPKVALAAFVGASLLDSYEGGAVVDFNVAGDNKFVKVGCLKAALKLASSKGLFDKLTKNELSLSANVLGEAKVQVTTGQLGLVAVTAAALKYVAPLLVKKN